MATRKSSPFARARKLQQGAGHVGFASIEAKAAAEGAKDPAAVAAAIGRRKYGPAGMGALSAAARAKSKAKKRS